ncbi:hypothetical protein MPPM_2330 [Methylorubrum populi]|uniref:Uncharacterized protein n=1 Tax=Methylorubrum populi TaxID=223967 RepID=A0A160PEL9_9HYPH|nr:hypothetical protein MPPM_2330 [Methylorubrum populi]
MAALPQADGRIEGDLGLPAIDMGMVENEDDVHGGSRLFPTRLPESRRAALAMIRERSRPVYQPAVDLP